MSARVLSVADLDQIHPESLCPSGELVVFPTDTVYGLGARPDDAGAIQRLRELKSRPAPTPFSLHVDALHAASIYHQPLNDRQQAYLHRLLPGPVTVLLPASAQAPPDAVFEGKIGLRVPGGTAFARVYRAFGPLLGTSVNRFSEPPLNTPGEILEVFGAQTTLLITSDEPLAGSGSAVIDLTCSPPCALRGTLPELGDHE